MTSTEEMARRSNPRIARRGRDVVRAAPAAARSGKRPVTLNWYVFPEPSGSFQAAANACSNASRRQVQDRDQLPLDRVGPAARLARQAPGRERLLDRHPRDGRRLDGRVRQREVDPAGARRARRTRSGPSTCPAPSRPPPTRTGSGRSRSTRTPSCSGTARTCWRPSTSPFRRRGRR